MSVRRTLPNTKPEDVKDGDILVNGELRCEVVGDLELDEDEGAYVGTGWFAAAAVHGDIFLPTDQTVTVERF